MLVPHLRPENELAWNSSQREGSLELLFLWVGSDSPHIDVVIFIRLESDVDIFVVSANKFLRFDGFAKKGNDIRTGITYIAQVLKRNRTLKVLNLSENKLDVMGLTAIAEALVRSVN